MEKARERKKKESEWKGRIKRKTVMVNGVY